MVSKIKMCLLAAMMAASVCWGQGPWTSGGTTVTLAGGELTVSPTNGVSGAMADYTNTATSRPWNSNRASITSVVIQSGVTSIGNYAFGNTLASNAFENLVSVTIPNSVTSIGTYAFSGSGLTGVLTIPNSVTTIGTYAFYNCSGLTGTLTIPNSVTSIGNQAFYGCSGLTGALTIPNSVTSIGNGTFQGCSGFTSVTIGNGVTSIGGSAFNGCIGLTGALTIPNSVETIGQLTFRNCGFTSVTIGNSVTSIGQQAFYGCSGLTGALIIPNSVTTIGQQAFQGCSGFTSVTIGNGVTSIGDGAFEDCSGLTSVTIGTGLTTAGGNLFSGCSGLRTLNFNARNCENFNFTASRRPFNGLTELTTLTIGNQVESIPNYAFSGLSGLTGTLTIPNSVTTIGDYAFQSCRGLTGALTIPNSVTTIGSNAFNGCRGLTEVTIPNSVTTIGVATFQNCSGLTGALTIPNSVTSIGINAFQNCSGLTGALTIPNSVKTIGREAFYGCSGLTEVTIPNSVTTIEASAFQNCSGLETVTIGTGVASIADYAFQGCSGLRTLNFNAINCADFSGTASFRPFNGLTGLTTLSIGEEVTKFPAYAFSGLSGLRTLNFNAINCENFTYGSSEYPFYGLTGITSVTIGNQVESIPAYAFALTGVTNVTSYNATAPTVASDAFNSFRSTLLRSRLSYPCNSTGYTTDTWNSLTKELIHDWEWTVTTVRTCLIKGLETEACTECQAVNATRDIDEHCEDIASIVYVTVGRHATGEKQAAAHIEANEKYITVKNVSWSPEDETFRGSEVYKVTLTIEINDPDNYKFADNAAVQVNDRTDVSIKNSSATEITIEHTFPETDERTPTNIEIENKPTKMTYTHGNMLDLSDLTIKTTYDDGTTATRNFSDFLEYGGDVNIPNHEEPLTHVEHNGFEVVMGLKSLKVTVGKLTVSKANPTTPETPTCLTAKADQTLANVTLPTGWTWKAAGTTAVGAVGNRKHIAVFTPTDAANFNVIELELTIEVTAATSITNRQAKNSKYGIVLEKAVVSKPTTISVVAPENVRLKVTIYDNLGNIISEGETFDLKNKAGRDVANGTYLVVVEATGVSGKVYMYNAKIGVRR